MILYALKPKVYELGEIYDKVYCQCEDFEMFANKVSNIIGVNDDRDKDNDLYIKGIFQSWKVPEDVIELIRSCSNEEMFSYSWDNSTHVIRKEAYMNTSLDHMNLGFIYEDFINSVSGPFPNFVHHNWYNTHKGYGGDNYVVKVDRKSFLQMILEEVQLGIYDNNVGAMQAFKNLNWTDRMSKESYREYLPSILLFMLQVTSESIPDYAKDVIEEFMSIDYSKDVEIEGSALSEELRISLLEKAKHIFRHPKLYSPLVNNLNRELLEVLEYKSVYGLFDPYILENVYNYDGPSSYIKKFTKSILTKLETANDFKIDG